MKYYNFSNEIAVVTGASRGIGKAIAIKLAKYGAKVILISRKKESLDSVKKIIINQGNIAEYKICDISKLSSLSEAINQTINKWGKIDILINNAGITKDNLIIRMKEDEWNQVLDTNLKGCFNGIKSVAKNMMKNRRGRIVNISSVIGQIGNIGQVNYAASKSGIIGITKSMAKELGSRNITINAIAPGYISTEMTEKLEDKIKENLLNSIPLQRFGDTEDVANVVCFLCSDKAKYITGQIINVDGGMVMT